MRGQQQPAPPPTATPEQLLSEFDAKLQEINRLLGCINDPSGRGKADARGREGLSSASRASRRASWRHGEAAFPGDPPRVQSAAPKVPGASRALAEKIQQYRDSATARRDLYQRAKAHLQAMAGDQASDPGCTGINFIRANRKSLSQKGAEEVIVTTIRNSGAREPEPEPEPEEEEGAAQGQEGRSNHPPSFLTQDPDSPPRASSSSRRVSIAWDAEAAPRVAGSGSSSSRPSTSQSSRPALGIGHASTPAAGSPGPSFARPPSASMADAARPAHWSSGSAPRMRPASAATAASEYKAVRTVLTCRPASGGSPCRREPFRSEQRFLSAMRVERTEEVRVRRDELAAEQQERRLWVAGKRERQAQMETMRQQELGKSKELEERCVAWKGIVAMGHKLSFMVAALKADRSARPVRALRKQAAVRIATWYKKILIRRRQREMFDMIRRVKVIMKKHVPRVKQRVHRESAERITKFMQDVERQQTNMATVAIRRFRRNIHQIQSWWRVMLSVRRMQFLVLSSHFLKYERQLVRSNKQSAAQKANAALLAATLARGRKQAPVAGPAGTLSPSLSSKASRDDANEPSSSGTAIGRRCIELDAPDLDAVLGSHKEMLPKEVRARVIEEALHLERRHFFKRMDKYRSEVAIYHAQQPIEQLRLKLMREAGLSAESRLKVPVRPRMFVLLPRAKLKGILHKGILILAARQNEYMVQLRQDNQK